MKSAKLVTVMVMAAGMSVLALIYGPVTSTAQTTGPCAEDMKKYCSDVTKGGGRLLRCYEERKDKMSAACISWAELAKSNATAVRDACSKEIASSCNREKGDPLEMLDCLYGNYIDLSMGCRDKLNRFKGMYPLPVQ